MRILATLAFALVLSSCSGQVDLGRILQQVRPVVQAPAAESVTATSTDAIKQVIERANAAQQKAFTSGEVSGMRDTATAAYLDEMAKTNSDLAKSGVTSFELVKIDWGEVTVDGSTAHATSYETWRTRFADGSIDQRTDRNDYTLVLEGSTWKVQSDDQPDARLVIPATDPTSGQQPGGSTTPAHVSDTSSNWSGYVATGGSFTSITATWSVPHVAATTAGADATWVGIGGTAGTDLIQAGTQATVDGSGSVEYMAWTETLPQSTRSVPLRVNAGDSVTVTLTESSTAQWSVVLVNNTTKDSYQTTLRYSSSHSSAEWIQEAPSAGRGLVPLDEFGTVSFSRATAERDGKAMTLAALGAKAIAMINGSRQNLATPSTLDASGSAFSVSRTQAPSTGGGPRPFRRRS